MAKHGHSEEHHIGHVAPMKILLGVWGALMALTIITVLATKIDLGREANLGLAMFIATIKATLVVLYFMHLRWDRLFHTVLIVGGILAAALFVGFALMDSGQYQDSIIWSKDAPPAAPYGPNPFPDR